MLAGQCLHSNDRSFCGTCNLQELIGPRGLLIGVKRPPKDGILDHLSIVQAIKGIASASGLFGR